MNQLYAVTHIAPETCELQLKDCPIISGDHVGGKTLASLISPGTELASAYCGTIFPKESGYSSVFQIDELGSDVEGLELGQLVFSTGGHRSRNIAHSKWLAPVPKGLDPVKATLARLMAVSHTTLITTRARPGDTVVITGLGPVGYLAAAQFKMSGYHVIASDIDPARRASAAQLGIEVLETLNDTIEAALCIDCSGHEDAVLACCDATRRCGEVVLVGVPWKQRSQASSHAILHKVFHRYINLRSGWEWELPRTAEHFSDTHTILSAWKTCLNWLAEDRIPLPENIIAKWDPKDCQAAYQGHLKQSHSHLCTVFDWEQFSTSQL